MKKKKGRIKGIRNATVPRVGIAIFNRVTSIRHIEKVRFSRRLEGNRVNQVDD